jgi:2-keto-3-deoxy-6-phosphogluconate aldolase
MDKLQFAIDEGTGVVEVTFKTNIAAETIKRLSPEEVAKFIAGRLEESAKPLLAGYKEGLS